MTESEHPTTEPPAPAPPKRKRSKTIVLQGEPGCGKSMMAGLTAVRKPVHFLDIDRKLLSAGWAQEALDSGEITAWELDEPIDENNLRARTYSLAADMTKAAPNLQPQGWDTFVNMAYALPKKANHAGTWVVDSATILNEHFKSFIMWGAKKSKYTFDQWNALKIGWMDTLSLLRDMARGCDKDLIITVHERYREEPGDRVTGVTMELVKSGDSEALQRRFLGTQDVKVWASIDGQFGDLLGAQADEYYYLHVDMVNGRPVWKCRVKPDGRRNLRTSFILEHDEYEPDFRKIWPLAAQRG